MGDVEEMLDDLEDGGEKPVTKKGKKMPKKQEEMELDIDRAWVGAGRTDE